MFRDAPAAVIFRAAHQIGIRPSALRRWIDGEAELGPPHSRFVSTWLRKGNRPVWLRQDDYAQLRARFKGAVHGAVRHAARDIGISDHLLNDCIRKSVNPDWNAVHSIKRWLASTDRDVLRPVPRSVMAAIRRAFKGAPIAFRRATARAIGVAEPELSRWTLGDAQPGVANSRLIKEWWSRGGFDYMEKSPASPHVTDPSQAVIKNLRALLVDAPRGALRVAASDSGIDANSLGAYVSGARRATAETMRQIDAWLATVDVKAYQGFTPEERQAFRAKYGRLSRPEKTLLAQELGVTENSLDGWYRGSAQPKLLAVRFIRVWLQNGNTPPSPRRKRSAAK